MIIVSIAAKVAIAAQASDDIYCLSAMFYWQATDNSSQLIF
jgi:hypothetical protein